MAAAEEAVNADRPVLQKPTFLSIPLQDHLVVMVEEAEMEEVVMEMAVVVLAEMVEMEMIHRDKDQCRKRPHPPRSLMVGTVAEMETAVMILEIMT